MASYGGTDMDRGRCAILKMAAQITITDRRLVDTIVLGAWAFRLQGLTPVVSRRPIPRPSRCVSRSDLRGDADFLTTNKLSDLVTSTSALARNALSWREQNR